MKKILAAIFGISVAMSGAAANAATILKQFSLSGSGFSATGILGFDDSISFSNPYPCVGCAAGPGYNLTSVTGAINGDAITGLAPVGTVAGNDNRIYPTSTPVLDWGDIGFLTATTSYNAFDGHYDGRPSYYLFVTGGGVYDNPISFSLSEVPEPLTLSLFGAGLAGAAALRRRKRAQKV